jgi:hypothetical protein
MASVARFPTAPPGAGMYESFYLRTFSPTEPVGLWIRYTVHKAPDRPPRGSIWCVAFDARRGRPFMHKLTRDAVTVPDGGRWIAIDEDGSFGPAGADGRCGEASWSLRVSAAEPELRHLSPELLYRTPLPRTKLTSPAPVARFEGTFGRAGADTLELDGCSLTLPGARGLAVQAVVSVPERSSAGWRYADPDGGEHDVVNCSVARLELEVRRPGERAIELSTPHGGAYELGMREHDHGVPIAPFADG